MHLIEILKAHRKPNEEIVKIKRFNKIRYEALFTPDELEELDINVELRYARPLIRNCFKLTDLSPLLKKQRFLDFFA